MAQDTPTALVLELMTMGQQSAAHLGELLRAASPPLPGQHHTLATEILRCCGRVIAALSKKRKAMVEHGAITTTTSPLLPVMPLPSKLKRARGAEAHREVESGTTADGFMWRKYGQKDINGCKHPRLYYRCAYRDQGCNATRRVQRSQEEPAAFVIAYYGEHTCGDGAVCRQAAPLPPTVVDCGSNNARGGVHVDRDRDLSPLPVPVLPADAEQTCCDGETWRGWSSSSSTSSSSLEMELEVQELDASPVLEFLDGCFDWESVLRSLDFGDLPRTAMLQ